MNKEIKDKSIVIGVIVLGAILITATVIWVKQRSCKEYVRYIRDEIVTDKYYSPESGGGMINRYHPESFIYITDFKTKFRNTDGSYFVGDKVEISWLECKGATNE